MIIRWATPTSSYPLAALHQHPALPGIFCDPCSNLRCAIPKYGYEDETRVCQPCFNYLKKEDDHLKGMPPPLETASCRQGR